MAKVKIQSALASNFGHEVSFGEVTVKFDKLGFADVESKEIAEKLASTYEGWIYVGEIPKKDVKTKIEDADLNDIVAELERTKNKVEDREATIKALENECAEWKRLVETYKEQAAGAINELEGYSAQSNKQIKELELKVTLTSKTTKELIEICKTLEIPDERYKDANKSEIITIILDESRNK